MEQSIIMGAIYDGPQEMTYLECVVWDPLELEQYGADLQVQGLKFSRL
jgi:hypothetical protein